jgi:hypothetical protein
MKRPSFQFYPADWLSNTNLRRCSHAARGAWMDVLCVLHGSDEYGLIRFTLRELSSAIGAPHKLLMELVQKGVLKGCDKGRCEAYIYRPISGRVAGAPVTLVPEIEGPVWYSSRMIRDEHVRQVRGVHSRFQQTPKHAPKASPNPPKGEGLSDGSTSSSSSSSSKQPSVAITPAVAVSRPRARALARPQDVSEATWADWLTHRRGMRAAVTAAAMDGIRAEAERAGMPLEDALTVAMARGWRGFKAEWVRERESRDDRLRFDPARTLATAEGARRLLFGDAPPDAPADPPEPTRLTHWSTDHDG